MTRSLYTKSQIGATTTTLLGSEIDLRQWYDDLIYGTATTRPHGHWLIVRHFRYTNDGKRVACSCLHPQTNEASPTCPYCYAEGYLWDEKWYLGYSAFVGPQGGLANKDRFTPPGDVKSDYKAFYLRYDTPFKANDKVVEVLLDIEGKIVVPCVRTNIFKPQTIAEYRADNGRMEFIAIYCREEDSLRPDNFTGVT